MSYVYRVMVAEGDRIRAGLATQLLALATGVSADDMGAPGRLPIRARKARRLAMYLAHVGYGWPLERVSHAFGVNRATVGSGCLWAEDAREDPSIDALMDWLETAVRDLCQGPRVELMS